MVLSVGNDNESGCWVLNRFWGLSRNPKSGMAFLGVSSPVSEDPPLPRLRTYRTTDSFSGSLSAGSNSGLGRRAAFEVTQSEIKGPDIFFPCGCGSKTRSQRYACFGLWCHFPRCHFGTIYLSRSHVPRTLDQQLSLTRSGDSSLQGIRSMGMTETPG